MRNFQKKRNFKSILITKPVLVLLIFILLFFAFGIFRFWEKMNITIENKNNTQNKLLELQTEKNKLSSDINKLQTPNGIEETIREKFGLVKDGENVIILVEDKNTIDLSNNKSNSFFNFIKSWFK